ncbi:hypothetical protein HOK68_02825 [Candidatus Woesearchaeota archaeon]|nr:hypothetical protein [Candidatus Woesearchaeota archaeon]MBT4387630.1 hypothetical protein [Candidatus Woesearchaeota archaeon]MBT4596007.1 hypothetical protein [Candidatus Woesearchaeota archaeon]MBT5740714.1 hypothetical protein [Candidatus Woesearchaeota archaeon]MBT6505686.1 hypothetical protein [Candidatus Woesearchaeota archaeon]
MGILSDNSLANKRGWVSIFKKYGAELNTCFSKSELLDILDCADINNFDLDPFFTNDVDEIELAMIVENLKSNIPEIVGAAQVIIEDHKIKKKEIKKSDLKVKLSKKEGNSDFNFSSFRSYDSKANEPVYGLSNLIMGSNLLNFNIEKKPLTQIAEPFKLFNQSKISIKIEPVLESKHYIKPVEPKLEALVSSSDVSKTVSIISTPITVESSDVLEPQSIIPTPIKVESSSDILEPPSIVEIPKPLDSSDEIYDCDNFKKEVDLSKISFTLNEVGDILKHSGSFFLAKSLLKKVFKKKGVPHFKEDGVIKYHLDVIVRFFKQHEGKILNEVKRKLNIGESEPDTNVDKNIDADKNLEQKLGESKKLNLRQTKKTHSTDLDPTKNYNITNIDKVNSLDELLSSKVIARDLYLLVSFDDNFDMDFIRFSNNLSKKLKFTDGYYLGESIFSKKLYRDKKGKLEQLFSDYKQFVEKEKDILNLYLNQGVSLNLLKELKFLDSDADFLKLPRIKFAEKDRYKGDPNASSLVSILISRYPKQRNEILTYVRNVIKERNLYESKKKSLNKDTIPDENDEMQMFTLPNIYAIHERSLVENSIPFDTLNARIKACHGDGENGLYSEDVLKEFCGESYSYAIDEEEIFQKQFESVLKNKVSLSEVYEFVCSTKAYKLPKDVLQIWLGGSVNGSGDDSMYSLSLVAQVFPEMRDAIMDGTFKLNLEQDLNSGLDSKSIVESPLDDVYLSAGGLIEKGFDEDKTWDVLDNHEKDIPVQDGEDVLYNLNKFKQFYDGI